MRQAIATPVRASPWPWPGTLSSLPSPTTGAPRGLGMRILIADSRYASGSASGEPRVVEDERKLLTDRDVASHLESMLVVHPSLRSQSGIQWKRGATAAYCKLCTSRRLTMRSFAVRASTSGSCGEGRFPILFSPLSLVAQHGKSPRSRSDKNPGFFSFTGVPAAGGHRAPRCRRREPLCEERRRRVRSTPVSKLVSR